MRADDNVDSFSLFDEHSAVRLRLILKAIKDFISVRHITTVEKAARLIKIWEQIMLRRINASRVFSHGGRFIENQLPNLIASTIVVTSTPRETEDYHTCASQIPEKQRPIPEKLKTATGDTGYDSTSPNAHYGCLPVLYFREPVPAVKERKRG